MKHADWKAYQNSRGPGTDERFDLVWDVMAAQGQCDERGGAEYQRVHREWVEAGRPGQIGPFVRDRANIGPGEA